MPRSLALILGVVIATATGCANGEKAATPESSDLLAWIQDDTALAERLIELRDRDQEARAAANEAMKNAERGPDGSIHFTGDGADAVRAVRRIDAESTAFLRAMLESRGWPKISEVGEKAANAAWLLAQHADAAPALQARILEAMAPLAANGEAGASQYALLTDRVRLARGEPQIYGTQFQGDENGILRPRATLDWTRVDERRAEVGLEPIAEYAKSLREVYAQPVDLAPLEF